MVICPLGDRQDNAAPGSWAVLLVAGDKSGQWKDWYKRAIPLAEERYERWRVGEYDEERT